MIKGLERVARSEPPATDKAKTRRLEAKQALRCLTRAKHVWNGVSTCWLHTGSRDNNGYARITVQRTRERIVSRLVLCLRTHRPYPIRENPKEAGHMTPFICRKGNRHCINPYHLQWETRAQGLARRQRDILLLPLETQIMAEINELAERLTKNLRH
jgi:hypothetical protein